MINDKKKYLYVAGLILLYFTLNKKDNKTAKENTTPIKSKGKLTAKQIDFINLILPSAKAIESKIGIPYQFIIAQICIESGFGKSSLTTKYFNFGGIKQLKDKPFVRLLTTECENGICKKVYQNFAVFRDLTDGLFYQAKIYSNKYFKQYLNKTKNPYEYAKLLQSGKVKYATSLTYVQTISKMLDLIIKAGF